MKKSISNLTTLQQTDIQTYILWSLDTDYISVGSFACILLEYNNLGTVSDIQSSYSISVASFFNFIFSILPFSA